MKIGVIASLQIDIPCVRATGMLTAVETSTYLKAQYHLDTFNSNKRKTIWYCFKQ